VVSGTTVRALVLGRFSQKKIIKIELKDNAKKMNKKKSRNRNILDFLN